jgi:4-hydroxy-3-methylbut-2-en-1-yl diphosphate reductase
VTSLTILTPLSIEARAVRAGLRAGTGESTAEQDRTLADRVRVHRVGIGPRSATRATRLMRSDHGPVLVAGFCGALSDDLEPGDVVLASELRSPDGTTTTCPDPAILAGVLRRGGLRVHVGPIASSARLVTGARRSELRESGAVAVDMESAWLAAAIDPGPLVVLRVVLDTPRRELRRPWQTLGGVAVAYRSLRRACSLLGGWIPALGSREVVLAAPRASCAGVVRAVEIVERALEARGAPIYVRKQIVHNAHVVAELERRGAIFVEEVDEVPRGATAIFSAHGVSPAVRAAAAERRLDVIDATCPLVAKVHAEARRFADAGFDIVLIGHEGHEEVEGTVGEAPQRTRVVVSANEVDQLWVQDPGRVAYLTQTTLAIDETEGVVDALRERFPGLSGPASSDICYATQNRQDAVRALAADCDIMFVVGSENSSNSRRLVEVAQRAGCPAALIGDGADIPSELVAGAKRVGLTAGASAPEALVQDVVRALQGLGGARVSERTVVREDVHFKLPPQVRSPEVISCPSR